MDKLDAIDIADGIDDPFDWAFPLGMALLGGDAADATLTDGGEPVPFALPLEYVDPFR